MSAVKKRKLESDFPGISQAFLAEVNGEVNTEIALKHQLTDTLESRIAWALMLQDSIKEGSGNASEYTFQNEALDALSLGEQGSEFIFQRDPPPPPSMGLDRIARPIPQKSYSSNFKPKPSFLYIRSKPLVNAAANSENYTYILKCPECSRTTFTALQGLLNHARLAHNLEWGTHDECIRSCSVVDNDLDLETGTEVGLGPVGILPGLRTLFQKAVSSQDTGKGQPSSSGLGSTNPDGQTSGENHLVKTLGFHGESPALAPFLGKETMRREIKVWDEDVDVDVFGNESSKPHIKNRWKMPFTPRNFAENSVAGTQADIPKSDKATKVDQNHDNGAFIGTIAKNVVSHQSRFHFISRIIITDSSLWIPVDKRSKEREKYSHKWMISVDSPAYAHHITSVLNSVKVGPSDATLCIPTPETTSKPPFVVVGFADRPFLAKVELSFSGTSSHHEESRLLEQTVSFEHWVDLGPLENPEVCVGQDQVLDVELDKSTVLKPPRIGYYPLGTKSLWNKVAFPPTSEVQRENQKENGKENGKEDKKIEQKYEYSSEAARELSPQIYSILNRIVKQFPMTSSSTKGNRLQASSIPYRLAPTPAYFSTLVVGRRKAIEWSRARAIQDAYSQEIQNLQDESLIPLSVADVFRWMSEHGHFIREKKIEKKIAKKLLIEQEFSEPQEEKKMTKSDVSISQWCRICGLEADLHSMTELFKMEDLDDEGTTKTYIKESYRGVTTLMSDQGCHIVPRVLQIAKLPKIVLPGMSSSVDSQKIQYTRNYVTFIEGSLVATADPDLILSIHKMLQDLRLPKFRHSMDNQKISGSYPLDVFGNHRMDVENTLSPSALLAHLVKQFVRILVSDGLEVVNRDKLIASGLLPSAPQRGNRRSSRKKSKTSLMLTPTHILSGILTRGRGRGSLHNSMDAVILSSLSKLGMAVESNDQATPSCQGEINPPRVKLEE